MLLMLCPTFVCVMRRLILFRKDISMCSIDSRHQFEHRDAFKCSVSSASFIDTVNTLKMHYFTQRVSISE